MKIRNVGVIGAGQMGAGIAQVCANAGSEVLLYDTSDEQFQRGIAGIEKSLAKFVEKEKMSSAEAEQTRSRISQASSLSDLSNSDLVIEAIVENAEIKQKVFRELESQVSESCILASNTSSISITLLGSCLKKSDRMIGLHFMNPVPIMQLVEVIRGLQTSDETYERSVRYVEQLQKTKVLGIDAPGFVVNRILCPMINEAIFLLEQGVEKEDIDTAMKLGTNQPMGPLELADFVGLDTLLYILRILHRELGEDKYRPCPLLVKYVEAGWFGRKSGKGFYEY